MTDTEPAAKPAIPAGWYPSVKHPGLQQWWTGTDWDPDHLAPLPQQVVYAGGKAYKTSHGFHLIMTILTCGLWGLFVWLPMGIYNSVKNK